MYMAPVSIPLKKCDPKIYMLYIFDLLFSYNIYSFIACTSIKQMEH